MPSDARAVDDRQTTRARRRYVAAAALVVVVGIVIGTWLYFAKMSKIYNCADVGLRGPEAPTPAAAFDAYVRSVEQSGGVTVDRTKWHQVGDSFQTDDAVGVPMGRDQPMWSVSVNRKPNLLYYVSGACVGSG